MYYFLKKDLILNTNKGFAIVEGVVFIALVGIFGFISLQGYSSDARNSKRISDINNMLLTVSIKMAEGGNIMAFITENNENKLNNLSVGGARATSVNYSAGTPNYTALGVRSEEFLDPNGAGYIIGATTTGRGKFGGGRFQFGAVLETSYGTESLIKGTYKARTKKNAEIDKHIGNGVIVVRAQDTNIYSRYDYVNIGSNRYQILKIKRDGMTLTLDKSVQESDRIISLAESEGESLIADHRDNNVSVLNGSTTAFPY